MLFHNRSKGESAKACCSVKYLLWEITIKLSSNCHPKRWTTCFVFKHSWNKTIIFVVAWLLTLLGQKSEVLPPWIVVISLRMIHSYPHWRGQMRCLYYEQVHVGMRVSKCDAPQPKSSQIPWKCVAPHLVGKDQLRCFCWAIFISSNLFLPISINTILQPPWVPNHDPVTSKGIPWNRGSTQQKKLRACLKVQKR